MKTSMKRTVVLCIALCLGLTSACVQVDVSVTSQGNKSVLPPSKPPISMDDLKKLHTTKSCRLSSLDVAKEQQQTAAWCWTASTRMVMEYHNKQQQQKPADPQCNIVMNVLSNLPRSTNCCEKHEGLDFIDAPSKCVQGGWPHWVLEEYGFSYETVSAALDWDALTGEICTIGPFISVIEWSGGGKHAFVVKGYRPPSTLSPLKVIEVYDPIQGDPQDMTFDEFVGDSPRQQDEFRRFSHHLDFVQILPKDKP